MTVTVTVTVVEVEVATAGAGAGAGAMALVVAVAVGSTHRGREVSRGEGRREGHSFCMSRIRSACGGVTLRAMAIWK